MARTKAGPRYKIYSIIRSQPFAPGPNTSRFRMPRFLKSSWLEKQPNTPRILSSDPLQEMKKLIKYYPKKISSLKAITLAFYSEQRFEPGTKKIYHKILSKYPKYMFRYFCLNLDQPEMDSSSSFFLKALRHLQVLYVYCQSRQSENYQDIPSLLKRNKCLSRVLLETASDRDDDDESKHFSIRWFRSLKRLQSLQLDEIPLATSHEWKRALPKVEILTLFDQIYQESLMKKQMIDGISHLTNLKKINCECFISDLQTLQTIPFGTFEKKDILCDFRIHFTGKESSKPNLETLSQIDFLGISSKSWDSWIPMSDPFQISNFNLQRQSKNLLLLEGAESFMFDTLLKSCQNITTLDLFLSGEKENQCSLAGLRNLSNLKHLSLRICDYNDNLAKNFKDLAEHAKLHQKLTYLSLCIKTGGKINARNSKNILLFLDAIKDTLSTLLFNSLPSEDQYLESIYKKISSYKNLKSFYLNCNYSSETVQKSLPDLLKSLTSQSLEELSLSLDENIDAQLLEPSFAQPTKLTKLLLRAKSFDKSIKLFNTFSSNLTELKELELVLEIFPKRDWNTLARSLVKLPKIELLKIRSQDEPLLKIDETEIQEIILNHHNLKLVALGNAKFLTVIVRKHYSINIDSFLCRFHQGLLDNMDHKITYI